MKVRVKKPPRKRRGSVKGIDDPNVVKKIRVIEEKSDVGAAAVEKKGRDDCGGNSSSSDGEEEEEGVTTIQQRSMAPPTGANISGSSGSDGEADDGDEVAVVDMGAAAAEGGEGSAAAAAAAGGKNKKMSFRDLGVCEELAIACDSLGWSVPTPIQSMALPHALKGRDIVGIAETGSGKTAAFAIPILQQLLVVKQKLFGLVLAPTRELSDQIAKHFLALGSSIDLRVAVIIGGVDMISQTLTLAEKPHIIVASPGRLLDHLENTKGFTLKSFKFLVMDEADRLLSMDFETALNRILEVIPRKRVTYMYSATMTTQLNKLKRASLVNPIKVSVGSKHDTAANLIEHIQVVPFKFKMTFAAALLDHLSAYQCMVFVNTKVTAKRLTIFFRHLGYPTTSLHGGMPQPQRLGALERFRAGERRILVATEVGSRGLDIKDVDVVVNFDVPTGSKDYIHRVGRTARAGRTGRAITLVTQYDVVAFQKIEKSLGVTIDVFDELTEEQWRSFGSVAAEAARSAEDELRESLSAAEAAAKDKRNRSRGPRARGRK